MKRKSLLAIALLHCLVFNASPSSPLASWEEDWRGEAPTQDQKEANANMRTHFRLKSLPGVWEWMLTINAGGGGTMVSSDKKVIITQSAPGVISFSFSYTEMSYREIISFPNPIRIPEPVTRKIFFRLKQNGATSKYLLTAKISPGPSINNLPLTFNDEGELAGEGVALIDGEKYAARASIKMGEDGEHTWTLTGSDTFSISFNKAKKRSRGAGKQ